MSEHSTKLGTGSAVITRRGLITRAGVAASLGAAASIAAPFIRNAVAAQDTLKIGMIFPKQGPQTEQGAFLTNGCRIALEQAGSKLLGRPCELIWLDEPNAQAAQQNAQKLIEEEKVIAIEGGGNSSTALAISAVARRTKIPVVIPNAAAREITGKECNPYTFRSQATVPVACRAMAPYLLERGKRWYFITANYAFGQDIAATFRELLKGAGGSEAGTDQTPLGTTDYSSFVLKIRQARPEVVIAGLPGDDLSNFLKQYNEIGLRGKIPVACPIIGDSDIEAVGPDVATGIYGKPWDRNDPGNGPDDKTFARDFRSKFGKPANDKSFLGWLSTKMLLVAIENAQSTDPKAIIESLHALRLQDGPTPAYFRDWDHQLLRRWLVVGVKDKVTDKTNYFDILRTVPENAAGLDALYGSKAEVGCNMGGA